LVNLLTEQVVGFYDPKTKVLYVVDGAPRDMATMTVTHELIHALQDQYVNLDSLQFLRDNDRKMAAQAVFEGEALYEQFAVNGVELNVPGGWNRVRGMMRKSQSAMPIFAAAPPLIRETLLFPYLDGADFIKAYKARRGRAVPFADMPQSTEQILHPDEAYFGTRDAPTAVSFAPLAAPGMTPMFDDDLGEFETSIFVFGPPADSASRQLADGWDGDHYLLFATPHGNALAWASVWDSPRQAHRVQAALDRRLAERVAAERRAADRAAKGKGDESPRTRTLTAGNVDGRPVLLYLDLPKGVDPAVISLSSVQLGPQ
jgi:hypothetical protein